VANETDKLRQLREDVASGKSRGAQAHIRLAEALIAAGQREEAIAVLESAISSNLSETGSELDVVRQEAALRNLLAGLVSPEELARVVAAQYAFAPDVGPFGHAEGEALEGGLAGDMIDLGGYEPEKAWAQAREEADVIRAASALGRALEHDGTWFEVCDHGARRYLRFKPGIGWQEILVDETGDLAGTRAVSSESAELDIFETLRQRPHAKPTAPPKSLLARVD
jgi:hypothetical protein